MSLIKTNWINIISAIIIACIFFQVMMFTEWIDITENIYYDLWTCIHKSEQDNLNTVIIKIDDKTWFEHRDQPLVFWGPHFAKAIEVLKKVEVRIIGLDFLFLVNPEDWLKKFGEELDYLARTYDISMRTKLNEGGVILSCIIAETEDMRHERIMPRFDYLAVLPNFNQDVGISNFYTDLDGVIRDFIPKYDINTEPNIPFATLLAIKALNINPADEVWDFGSYKIKDKFKPLPIGFIGPPKTIQRLSFSKLLKDNAINDPEIKSLKNKIIIIAEENTGNQDVHQTPYSRFFLGLKGKLMTGPEVQANIVETIISGKFPENLPLWFLWLYFIFFILIATLFFFNMSFVKAGFLLFFMCGFSGLVSYIFFTFYFKVPSVNVQLGMMISYLFSIGIRLLSSEKKREQLRKIFSKYVPDKIVDELISKNELPDIGGDEVEITILFSDIRNFTAISEKLLPIEVVEMLNEYFTKIYDCVLEEGGIIDKFIGDAVMVLFGVPLKGENHALKGIKCAIKMQEIANKFRFNLKEKFTDKNIPEFRIGIGIHTGKAIVGNIGSKERMEYTAIGDSVNIASRIESSTKELGWCIAVSDDCVKSVKAPNVLTIINSKIIEIKGREKKIEVHEVKIQN
ncbi:MAG: CHASE2 domain-containing protein [Desulfobacterales bacterium]|nr:CHASE2 domain-containing protein [Desulfobacterales bacterium]